MIELKNVEVAEVNGGAFWLAIPLLLIAFPAH
jgi:hypothetical protein